MQKAQIGLIGLGVMGANLALNIAEKGFRIAVYNRTSEKTVIRIRHVERADAVGALVPSAVIRDQVLLFLG